MSTITRLAGKTAIVTAASAGIGRGIAIAFAREGANVVLNGRHEARSHEVLARCREAGSAAELLLGDVAAPNTWKGLRQCALDHFGAIDILVNNAAHFFFRSALDTREEDWDKAMEVGVKSAWVGAKTCLPTMIARQSGCILNISSNMGLIGGRDSCGYIAAKGALHNLTLSLAADYGKANIRANTISPGPIASLGIATLDEHTPEAAVPALLAPLRAGRALGLMSEAGAPAVADPGARLVSAAHDEGFRVVPLTGPSSILLALMASGLEGQRFRFAGYLPVAGPDRAAALRALESRSAAAHETQVFIETPYRNDALLADVVKTCRHDTRLSVAADLTGSGESIRTASVAQWRRNPAPPGKRPAIFLLLARPAVARR